MVQGLKNISLEIYKNLNNNNMTKIRERNFNYLLSLGRRAKGEATPKVNKLLHYITNLKYHKYKPQRI